jgi:hypothetical protein
MARAAERHPCPTLVAALADRIEVMGLDIDRGPADHTGGPELLEGPASEARLLPA